MFGKKLHLTRIELMKIFLSLILFFIQATPVEELVDNGMVNTDIQGISQQVSVDSSSDFLEALPVDDQNTPLEFIETVEEEEKSESENESLDTTTFDFDTQFLIRNPKVLFNPDFTTKAKSGNTPLYTLFQSWKLDLA